MDAATLATARIAAAGSRPSPLGRVLAKMKSGQNVNVAFVGDSGFAGGGVTATQDYDGATVAAGVNGTDDAPSVLCTTLAARFGVTVTKTNYGKSGWTLAAALRDNFGVGAPDNKPPFTRALSALADVYLISFGHNDLRSLSSVPGTGYPLTAFSAALMHMIRRIRADVPTADIMVSTEWPYNNGASSNTYLATINQRLRAIAAATGCAFVDAYAAFSATGNVNHYIDATNHPNKLGHALWASTMAAPFPANFSGTSIVVPNAPFSLYGEERYTRTAWTTLPNGGRTYGQSSFFTSGSGWSSANAIPTQSSTANDQVRILFAGTECAVGFDTSLGTGVVKITVDNVPLTITSPAGGVAGNLDLSTLPVGQYVVPITDLDPGIHSVYLTVVSGTVAVSGSGAGTGLMVLNGALEWFDATSTRVTKTGTWNANGGGATTQWNSNNTTSTAITDSIAFDFVGTGCGMHMQRLANIGHQLSVSVDGGSAFNVEIGTASASGAPGWITLIKGLEYGRHSITVTNSASVGATAFQWGTVAIFDETRLARPRKMSGVAKVGDTVNFANAFTSKPALMLTATDATSTAPPYPTSVTSSSFVVNGTAGALVRWEAEGGLIAY